MFLFEYKNFLKTLIVKNTDSSLCCIKIKNCVCGEGRCLIVDYFSCTYDETYDQLNGVGFLFVLFFNDGKSFW